MTYSRREFLTGALALATGCATTRQELQEMVEPFHLNYDKNIGHILLDIEKAAGFPVPPISYAKLNDLLQEGKERVEKVLNPLDYVQSHLTALKEIDAIIHRSFTNSSKADTSLLGKSLSQGRCDIDCDIISYLYLAIGEKANLPLKAVIGPEHMFVRWHHKFGYTNWETTAGTLRSDEEYITWLNIHPTSLTEGVYLQSLSRKELIGKHFENIGTELLLQKEYKKALPLIEKALELYPKSIGTITSKGIILEEQGHFAEALELYREAFSLDENSATTNKNLGIILKKTGRTAEGRRFHKKAKELKEKRP